MTTPRPGDWAARAARVIPGGSSTGSKRPAALYGSADAHAPTHFVRAAGCHLDSADGPTLTDFTMSLGAVALGYADPGVTAAVQATAAAGNVAGLSHVLEVEVAERLCEVIPCAEQVRFLKTGAEGVAAAVRIARTATRRDLVIGCGYFGWLDWWSRAAGVPEGAAADFLAVPYDDVQALEQAVAVAGDRLAAVIIEPVIERLPDVGWLRRARELCEIAGAVLIFDEVKTGFRVHSGGYQARAGVRPHLAVFGKALANGYPLSAVVGERAVMEATTRTWISSTLAGEGVALAAAGAVLDRHATSDVCGALWRAGERQMAIAREVIAGSGVAGVAVHGIPPMWFLRVDDAGHETRLLQSLTTHGVLLKRGAYNFAALPHDRAAEDALRAALTAALADSDRPSPAPR
ncbi:MAG: aminotransferase class III-fold pyridoxal phosphate-dependent enzyme [Gemmatimonadaceae bacterium]